MAGPTTMIVPPWGDRFPTADEVDAFVATMNPGDCVEYHTGFLSRDREGGETVGRALGVMADRFYSHGVPRDFRYARGREIDGRAIDGKGSGTLSQVRIGEGQYSYRFTKEGKQ